jgi:photosystem II stability/assembly factor-like uncharacterized protein
VLIMTHFGFMPVQAERADYTWSAVTIKANGFINGIVYSPAGRDIVYINTDMGGAYRWDIAAEQWVCMTDWARFDDPSAKHMGIETLAVDPTDANRVYFSIGTYMSPTAILRSTDGGRTLSRTDVPFQSNGNGSARNTGQRMVVDPNLPGTLYYGTRVDGLWKSTDHARSWSRVKSFPAIGHNEGWGRHTGIMFVHIDRTSGAPGEASEFIYAGVFEIDEGAARIYRSTDGGLTWAGMPGGQPAGENLFPQRLAMTPDGATLYITYATSTSYPGPWGVGNGRVFKVTDPSGDAPQWTDVTPFAGPSYSAIALDPSDPSIVYAGELGNYNPADRIWRSIDAGVTWRAINPNRHRDDSSAPWVRWMGVHWLGDLQIDPFDRDAAMFTTGYGLYRTSNLTADEPTWVFFNEGFEQSAGLELATPYDGPVHLISAIGDRDGYRHVDFATPPDYQLGRHNGLAMGTCVDIDVARNDSRHLVRLVQSPPFAQYSTDNGVNWAWFPAAPEPGRGGQIAISADATRVVWHQPRAAEVYYAERADDGWGPWQKSSRDSSLPRQLLVVADLDHDEHFYGIGEGAAFRSTDGGNHWEKVSDAAPAGQKIRAVPGRPGHLWACGYGEVGLCRSTDGGQTWRQVDPANIPMAYVVGVGAARSPGHYPSLFIGGRVSGVSGIFRSDDEGASWVQINDDANHYGHLTTIQGDPRVYGRVYLATNGRGIVVGDIAGSDADDN